MAVKALCVGINKFKNFPSAALQGCVNDVKDMKSILTGVLGFKKSDIVMLTDSTATKAKIMAHLKDMVDGAKKGKYNYLVFSLSSHGTQVPDVNGDEPDKADEAFCPYDLAQAGDQWDPKNIITDDELHDLFATLPENVLLEVFLDTCHSGTGLKAIDMLMDRKPRYLPPPSYAAFKKVDGRVPRGLNTLMLDRGSVRHILWAGCRPDQTSADARINGTWHGAFTHYFSRELRKSKNKMSRAQLLKKVRAALAKGHYTQIPQLESQSKLRKTPVGRLGI